MKIVQIGNSILINEDCLKAMDFLIEKGIAVKRMQENLN